MAKNKKKSGTSSSASVTQTKTFAFELYPEWDYYNTIIAHICKYKYWLCTHNMDVNEETGELKKVHTHAVIQFDGHRTLSAVQNEFVRVGLEKRFVQTCNLRAMLRYLIHKDDPDKYQYPKSAVKTNMPTTFENALIDTIDDKLAFKMVNDWIDEQTGFISVSAMNNYIYANGLMDGFRRYSSALRDARIEHNKDIEIHDKVADELEKERVRSAVASSDMLDKTAKMVEVFGMSKLVINGKEYMVQEVQKPKSDDTDNTEYEQIDMLKEARKHE